LIFVALAIHVPSILADSFVLAARGFPPFSHLADLLWKQVLFFGCVILPAIAVAALVPTSPTLSSRSSRLRPVWPS
jgi:hypothetical protein